MAEASNIAGWDFWRGLFSLELYKRSQGRLVRQVTFWALALGVALGAWSLFAFLTDKRIWFVSWILDPKTQRDAFDRVNLALRYGLPFLLCLAGWWVAFRVVQLPRFADFLIAVEAEVNKVSWPSRRELFRSALVVMITMFGLAFTLYLYDIFWQALLRAIGVLQTS